MTVVESSVDLMVKQGVNLVLNSTIRAISAWAVKFDVSKPTLMDMIRKYGDITDKIVESGQYQPKALPLFYKVPKWSEEREVNLADKAFLRNMTEMTLEEGLEFMGKVTGAWILACPEELIPDLKIYPNQTRAERFVALKKGFSRTSFEMLSRLAATL